MGFASFGPGILIITRTDITTPLPINVGFSQELTLDAAANTKELYGQNQWPLAVARGTIKATGKFKTAVISGIAWNAMFYGMSAFSSGRNAWNIDSTYTVGTSTAPTTVTNSSLFDADLGVVYSTLGLPLQRVASGAEAVGKYSVSAGVYQFVGADTAKGVKITYTTTSTTGQKLTLTNALLGTTPTFQVDYYTNFNNPTALPFAVRLFACVASKHSLPFKLEDFMIPEFEFGFFANQAGSVFDYYFPEVS